MSTPTPSLHLAAASCNRRPGALYHLTTPPYLTAYASTTNVVILSAPPNHIVLSILPIHHTPITCVTLHRPLHNPNLLLLVSSTTDGQVTLHQSTVQNPTHWTLVHRLQLYDNQPCVSVSLSQYASSLLITTAGMEGTIHVHTIQQNYPNEVPQLVGEARVDDGVLLEVVAIRHLSATCALVLAGGTDRNVHIFAVELGAEEGRAMLRFVGLLEGHRDWVRGLAFSRELGGEEGGCFVASGSKDWTARVWRLERGDGGGEAALLHSARVVIEVGGVCWSFVAIGMLSEHTGAVHTVAFGGGVEGGGGLRLLTASMDCSVTMWGMDDAGRWGCLARFGLMGGSAAHALGFFGAGFVGEGCGHVLGHNFAGALHAWRAEEVEVEGGGAGGRLRVLARPAPGGHFASVTDLDWEPSGRYLLSCSADKTARIYAEVHEGGLKRFVEWARPQMHGHAMAAVAFCGKDGRRYVSGAEEKMLRIFEAPSSFRLPGEKATFEYGTNGEQRAVGAVVPQLGLSNKATFDLDAVSEDGGQGRGADGSKFEDMVVSSFGATRGDSEVPLEEELKQRTLWPETAKLYGHGNEVSCVAVDLTHGVLASGCHAKAAKDAAIILWDVNSGVECGRLNVHDLTIHEMRFSKDGKRLLSVSRDRSFAIFDRANSDNRFSLELTHHKKGAHSRLIYCCSWLLGSTFVATGGRDKCLKIFAADKVEAFEAGEEVFKQRFSSGVSAVDAICLPELDQASILGVGFENGDLRIYSVSRCNQGAKIEVRELFSTREESRCGGRINKLQWRPGSYRLENGKASMQMAIGSEDVSVRVMGYELELGAP